ncbi:polyunsaturated fatty acid lipoxygenase ALOX15B-like [Synchiropus picturatus]
MVQIFLNTLQTTMATYQVKVQTVCLLEADTLNNVYIQLVGTDGQSEFQLLEATKVSILGGTVSKVSVSCRASLGKLLLVNVKKERNIINDSWFPSHAEVTSPEGLSVCFPIYCWISDGAIHSFRAGEALRIFEDYPLGVQNRQQEVNIRKEQFCWKVYLEGIPHCMEADTPAEIPDTFQFSPVKKTEFALTAASGLVEINLKGYASSTENWGDLEDIRNVFCNKTTPMAEYVSHNWKEDGFFGYQYLNGINPILIQQYKSLPYNFPVTDAMVASIVQGSLREEMEKGNIFLCDYKRLDGVKANIINGVQQFLMAPLVLLHKTSGDKMKPIAIQLKQVPAEDNPIFLPTDSEYDWLLAKIFVRGADFNEHQLNVHLLRTHLLAEVFAMALMRNIPMVHPLYKLLILHTRYTMQINVMARQLLISEDGAFPQFVASGGEGMVEILRRSTASITYSSLCLPEEISQRGMETVPNYFYRDDGLRLWGIINRFVEKVLKFYYKNDTEVEQDTELQAWIADIYQHGFLSRESSGIPQRFSRVDEVIKFVTMVIFTCSEQHAAVNSGQYDYDAWLPNSPTTLQRPPPTKKGTSSEEVMLATLPTVGITVNGMAVEWLLSKQSSDFIALGCYPQKHFTEETPCSLIKEFQEELKKLSESIQERNRSLDLAYCYMDPVLVENSVAI